MSESRAVRWLVIGAMAFAAGGYFGGQAADEAHMSIYKRLTTECRTELQEAARDLEINRD